jgi:hypothetical protein
MGLTAVITQPTYMPWLGYFEQMSRADVFVFLDSAQFVPRSWHCRNRLRGPDGQPFWLTVPVARHRRDTALKDILISPDQPRWKSKHLASLRHSLGRTPYFGRLFPDVERWLMSEWRCLADLNIAGVRMTAAWLGLSPRFLRASELGARGGNIELLIAICREVGATRYYSSLGSKAYIDNDPEAFSRRGIELEYQTWAHPTYEQDGGPFVSHLSALDALFHLGPDAARQSIGASILPSRT